MKTKPPAATIVILVSIVVLIGLIMVLIFKNEQAKAKRVENINADIDKIAELMNKVLAEPEDFAGRTKSQRDASETRLLSIANSVSARIDGIVAEMERNGYPYKAKLKKDVGVFFMVYATNLREKKYWYNLCDARNYKMKKSSITASDQTKKDAAKEMSDIQTLKVDTIKLAR